MEKYTGLENLAIANAKEEIRKAKEKMAQIENDRRAREAAASRRVAEERLAKWKMDVAREKFRVGYRKLMLDAKNADKTYNLAVTSAELTYQDLDTAIITLRVQRLP